MLVLSRKPGERIFIGDHVAVTIVRIGPNTVKLGIEAPRDMNIVREELCAGALPKALGGTTAAVDAHQPVRVAE